MKKQYISPEFDILNLLSNDFLSSSPNSAGDDWNGDDNGFEDNTSRPDEWA